MLTLAERGCSDRRVGPGLVEHSHHRLPESGLLSPSDTYLPEWLLKGVGLACRHL